MRALVVGTAVEGIASYALAGCTNLSYIEFPPGFDLTTIQTNAFFGCDSLKNICLHGVYKGSMSDETVYQMVRQYGLGVASDGTTFEVCVELEDAPVSIPASVPPMSPTTVQYMDGTTSSYNVGGILSAVEPGPTTQIPDMSSAVAVTLGGAVLSVGEYAFWGCPQLTGVGFSPTVQSIAALAFDGAVDVVFQSKPLSDVLQMNGFAFGLAGESLVCASDLTCRAQDRWYTTVVVGGEPYDYPIEGLVTQSLVRSVPY